jgi:hypothetical protein
LGGPKSSETVRRGADRDIPAPGRCRSRASSRGSLDQLPLHDHDPSASRSSASTPTAFHSFYYPPCNRQQHTWFSILFTSGKRGNRQHFRRVRASSGFRAAASFIDTSYHSNSRYGLIHPLPSWGIGMVRSHVINYLRLQKACRGFGFLCALLLDVFLDLVAFLFSGNMARQTL